MRYVTCLTGDGSRGYVLPLRSSANGYGPGRDSLDRVICNLAGFLIDFPCGYRLGDTHGV